jgi:hypothetical protein
VLSIQSPVPITNPPEKEVAMAIDIPISDFHRPYFRPQANYRPKLNSYDAKCISFSPDGLTGDTYSVTRNGQIYYLSGKLAEDLKDSYNRFVSSLHRTHETFLGALAEILEDGMRTYKEAFKKEFPSGSSHKDKKNKVDIFFKFLQTHLLSSEDKFTDAIPWRLKNSNHQEFLKVLVPDNKERKQFIEDLSKKEVELDITKISEQKDWQQNRYGYGPNQLSPSRLSSDPKSIASRIFKFANPAWKP